MANVWFRAYHGISSDPKWPMIARRSGQSVAIVVAVWMALLDFASQNEPRGSVQGFVCEDIDALMGLDDGTTEKVVQAMAYRGLIVDDVISSWEKRQANRQTLSANGTGSGTAMSSTERSRRYREKQRMQRGATDATQRNGDATDATGRNADATRCNEDATECNGVQRTDKIREDKNRIENISPLNPPLQGGEPERDDSLGYEVSWEGDAVNDGFAGIPAETLPPDREQVVRDLGAPVEGSPLDEVLQPGEGTVPAVVQRPEPAASQQPDAQPAKKTRATRRSKAGNEEEPLRPEDWERWYAAYPKHEGRQNGIKAWNNLVRNGKLPHIEQLMSVLEWQIPLHDWKRVPKYAPLPATYLNALRWQDEPPAPQRTSYAPDANGRTPYIRPSDEGKFKPIGPYLPKLPNGQPDYKDFLRHPEKYQGVV